MITYCLTAVVFAAALVATYLLYKHVIQDPTTQFIPDIRAEGKAVLVTGASSDVGVETCLRLLNLGAFVFACDKNAAALEKVFPGNGPHKAKLKAIKLDVTKEEDFERAFRIVKETIDYNPYVCEKRLFGLINKEGGSFAQQGASGLTDSSSSYKDLFEESVFGVCRSIKTFHSLMCPDSERFQESPVIINMSSVAGRASIPLWGLYSTAQSALLGYTDTLRREFSMKKGTSHFVRVAAVLSGFINSQMRSLPAVEEDSVYKPHLDFMKHKVRNITFQEPGVVGKMVAEMTFTKQIPEYAVAESKLLLRVLYRLAMHLPLSWADDVVLQLFK